MTATFGRCLRVLAPLVAGSLAAGCTSGAGPVVKAFPGMSPRQILAAAAQALGSARSVEIKGTISVDLAGFISTNQVDQTLFANGTAIGSISNEGGTAQIVDIPQPVRDHRVRSSTAISRALPVSTSPRTLHPRSQAEWRTPG